MTHYVITACPPKLRRRKEFLRHTRDPGNGDIIESLRRLIVYFLLCPFLLGAVNVTLWGLPSSQGGGGNPWLVVAVRAWVIESRREGHLAVR